MTRNILRGAAAILAVTAGLAGAAQSQESTNVVTTEGDWTVFAGSDPRECWAVSPPKSTVNTKDGQRVEVQRGDIRLYVAYRPGAAGEVSFTGGYPFRPGSTVDVNVGGQEFDLFTEGENAWTGSSAEDARLIAALRAGAEAVITGMSSRGTQTVDTFSLSGITAATNAAKAECQ
ncbi:invasion associated locus B family protein [Paracoccus sp. SCSIO 75233]|uniref:invasion associated locus B family protein n=1 Tax=Paracoccus sp. SCSIO 75233 TaxID=3017782 RepID=UPI0022F0DA42|nr:invasion associated locus B family protein [Paracoccus sp. SCSIO 75233]WBU52956.1 invasion associated locus B family protein [Paracoccus sp. SCSIO 75233]